MTHHPQSRSGWVFKKQASGLILPAGVVLGGTLHSYLDSWDSEPEFRGTRTLGAVPTYEELWDGPRPALESLIKAVPAQGWLWFLATLTNVLARDNVKAHEKFELVLSMFDRNVRSRLRNILKGATPTFPIVEFPVLLLLEIALANADFAEDAAQSDSGASLDPMVKAIYVLWSLLTEDTTSQTLRNPAGVAAALSERSFLGSPFRNLQTGFGLWAWDHAGLDPAALTARSRFDNRLRETIGYSLEQWVTGITLATMIAQNQPVDEAIAHPISITGRRNDLTNEGSDLLMGCLARVSATTTGLQESCRSLGTGLHLVRKPSLLALKRSPCLQIQADPAVYRVLSPVHLAESAVTRPRIESETDESMKALARQDLGTLTEAYIHGLLAATFGDNYQRLPSTKKRSRADGLIWFPNGFVVVECKARRSPEYTRYQVRDDESYRNELEGLDLGKAVAQVEQTTEDVLRGLIQHRCKSTPAVAGSIILFTQDIPLSEVSRSVLDEILPKTRAHLGVLRLRPQIMSIERVEELDKWTHLDLLSELVRKMQDRDVSLEGLNNFFLKENKTPRPSSLRRGIWLQLLESTRAYLTDPDGQVE